MVELVEDTHGGRDCERAARKLAGSSVFPTRSREVVHEVAQIPTLEHSRASELAKRLNSAGNFNPSKVPGITRQSHEITPKIVELDKLVPGYNKVGTPIVREVHPEICFLALNKWNRLGFSKKKSAGRSKRLAVLKNIESKSGIDAGAVHKHVVERPILDYSKQRYRRFLRREVAHDDIIDAIVSAVTAKLAHQEGYTLKTLPECPPSDSKGLPMEMVFVEAVTSTP